MATRKQLTLFANAESAVLIEQVRATYNPVQFGLIAAHVTLCREDELTDWDIIHQNLQQLKDNKLTLHFPPPTRFNNGQGVYLSAIESTASFDTLRKTILKGTIDSPRKQMPHITLLHPRNATCTDEIFAAISKMTFPTALTFGKISLIEQVDGGKWRVLEEFGTPPNP